MQSKQNKPLTFLVKEPTDLLSFIMKQFHGISKTAAKSYCTLRFIKVDGKIVTRPDFQLTEGQKITYEKGSTERKFHHHLLNIVYEDDYIIVINKKESLLSVSATESVKEVTAQKILQEYVKGKDQRNRIYVVHRLDRETSGLMLFAKNQQIQYYMRDNWKKIVFERKYTAVVDGIIKRKQGTLHSWIKENSQYINYSSQIPGDGQEAITHYRVLREGVNNTLVEVTLETGRKNQIRVHMQDIGHPIIGDYKYGDPDNDPLGRLCLHAFVLSFYHPVSKKPMKFDTPIPKQFLSILK